MGMDSTGPRQSFYWNCGAWRTVLKLASRNGWQPMGAGPSRKGGYYSNDGQHFYAKDAKTLASALEALFGRAPLVALPKKKLGCGRPRTEERY